MRVATRLFFSCIIGCFLAVPAMLAETMITQTCTINPAGVPYSSACNFNSFDTTLGTLDSVTMQLSGVNGAVSPLQYNFSAQYAIAFYDSIASVAMTLTGPDGTQAVAMATSDPCAGTIAAYTFGVATCGATTFGGLSGSSVSATVLADYEEVGSIFVIPITARGYQAGASGQSTDPNSSGNLAYGGVGSIGGILTLTYSFTPAPEPTTPALCGGSLLILAVFLRKRRSRMSVQ